MKLRGIVLLLTMLLSGTGYPQTAIVRETESGKNYSFFPAIVVNQRVNGNYDYATLNLLSYRERLGWLNAVGPSLTIASLPILGSFFFLGPQNLANPALMAEIRFYGLVASLAGATVSARDLWRGIRGTVSITPSATIKAWEDKLHNHSPYQANHDGSVITQPETHFNFADSMRLASIAEKREFHLPSQSAPIQPKHLIFQEHEDGISGQDAEVAYVQNGRTHHIPLQEVELPKICTRAFAHLRFRTSRPGSSSNGD